MKFQFFLFLLVINFGVQSHVAPPRNNKTETDEAEIKKLLVGNWVSKKLLDSLVVKDDFENAAQWLGRFRSLTFIEKNGVLKLTVETEFEMFNRDPSTISVKKLNDSIYYILIQDKKRKTVFHYEFNEKDTTITLPFDSMTIHYVKFDKVKKPYSVIEPLPYVYNWALLDGVYSVKDGENNDLSDNVIIKQQKITNLQALKFFYVNDDACCLSSDRQGKKYFHVEYNDKEINNFASRKSLAYARKKDTIFLYKYVYDRSAGANSWLLDSLKLQYILVKRSKN